MAVAQRSAQASLTRAYIKGKVIGWFSDHFRMPASAFPEKTNLRQELLFDNHSLVELGKYFNDAVWTPVRLYPWQYANCQTIGDIIDLIFNNS